MATGGPLPYDPNAFDEDEGPSDRAALRSGKRKFKDFDCPACSANNPYDEGFGDGDEVLCYYCGQEFRALVSDDGRLRLREA